MFVDATLRYHQLIHSFHTTAFSLTRCVLANHFELCSALACVHSIVLVAYFASIGNTNIGSSEKYCQNLFKFKKLKALTQCLDVGAT